MHSSKLSAGLGVWHSNKQSVRLETMPVMNAEEGCQTKQGQWSPTTASKGDTQWPNRGWNLHIINLIKRLKPRNNRNSLVCKCWFFSY